MGAQTTWREPPHSESPTGSAQDLPITDSFSSTSPGEGHSGKARFEPKIVITAWWDLLGTLERPPISRPPIVVSMFLRFGSSETQILAAYCSAPAARLQSFSEAVGFLPLEPPCRALEKAVVWPGQHLMIQAPKEKRKPKGVSQGQMGAHHRRASRKEETLVFWRPGTLAVYHCEEPQQRPRA